MIRHRVLRGVSFLPAAGLCALVAMTSAGCGSQMTATQKSHPNLSITYREEPAVTPATEDALLADTTGRANARRQEIDYLFSSGIHDAEHLTVSIANIARPMRDTDLADVNRSLTQLEVVRILEPALFTADELRAYDTRVAHAKVAAQSAIERRQEWELQQRNQAAYEWIQSEQRQQELDRQRTIEDLTIQLKQLIG